jgi:hypothetical protein
MQPDGVPSPRPPVFLGCFTAVAALLLLVGIVSFFIIYWESGANTGEYRLDHAEAYPRGSVQFFGPRNFFIARLADGSFLALDDLDAANRAALGRRCRVQAVPANDPTLPALLERYEERLSPAARRSRFLFREDCNGALYDFTGVRLDADGPNLDRYTTSIDATGHLVVNVSERFCSSRNGANFVEEQECRPNRSASPAPLSPIR